jgi:hypothetical protein
VGGGVEPAWARSGELFYRRLQDGRMMVVPVTTSPTLSVGRSSEPCATSLPNPGASPRAHYAVSADGKRFLMRTDLLTTGAASNPIVRVVQGWTEELKRLVPTD